MLEIIAQSPITLADLIHKTGESWVNILDILDPLLATGVVKLYDSSPAALPLYYFNG